MTFSISPEKKTLMFNGQAIYEAPGPITIEHQFNDKALIRYNAGRLYNSDLNSQFIPLESEELWEIVSRNVLLVDKDGTIIWRIENFNSENKPDPYLRATLSEGDWVAYTLKGYLKTFNIDTGEILTSEYSP